VALDFAYIDTNFDLCCSSVVTIWSAIVFLSIDDRPLAVDCVIAHCNLLPVSSTQWNWFLRTLCDDLRSPELIMDIELCSLEVLRLSYLVCPSHWAPSANESAVSISQTRCFRCRRLARYGARCAPRVHEAVLAGMVSIGATSKPHPAWGVLSRCTYKCGASSA
jgi:hypothetical protein